MKVLCINVDKNDFFGLTKNKWYEVEIGHESKHYYKLFCDIGYYNNFHKSNFLTEKEYRKLKLLKINESRR